MDLNAPNYNELKNENDYTEKELTLIKENIEKMDKHNQLEVLSILHNFGNDVTLNENSNGTLVNLSFLNKGIVDKLNEYVKYVENQESYLNNIEKQKEELKKLLTNEKNN
jgi:galactose-1-phosphate uridylyltransferase